MINPSTNYITDAVRSAATRVIEEALAEDIGAYDITSESVIPAELRFKGVMAARERVIVAGLPFAGEVFKRLAPDVIWKPRVVDGDRLDAGTVLAEIEGPARAMLTAERTALNLLQHLSGIATLTRTFVGRIAGTGATLLDTRKTIPGLRQLAKYATRVGGAKNHRMGLYDGVLIKDNHIAICGGVATAVNRAREASHPNIEVECDTLEQVRQAVAAGADIILLDNMAPDMLREAVGIVGGRAKTEASGGVTLESIRDIAMSGVDYISAGRITQSAPAVDIGLDWSFEG